MALDPDVVERQLVILQRLVRQQGSDIDELRDQMPRGPVLRSPVHDHGIPQLGTAAPTHIAAEGTQFWDTVNDIHYINDNGSTGWTQVGPGVNYDIDLGSSLTGAPLVV